MKLNNKVMGMESPQNSFYVIFLQNEILAKLHF